MTITSPRLLRPSIRARSCATTRFSTSPSTRSRLGASESISSKKMMQGARLLRVLENLAQLRFALAVEFLDDLRPADVDERRVGFVRHRAREQRLAAAGQAVQQHAFGRRHAETLENLGMGERQLDHFANLRDLALHAAEIVIGDDVLGLARRVGSARRRARFSTASRVSGWIITGPSGSVRTTWKSRWLPPNKAMRTRSPVLTASPSSRRAICSISSSCSAPPPKRRSDHAPGDGVSDLPDRRLLAERDAGVGAADAVELNDLLPPLLLEGGHRLGDGLCAAFDLQHVAGRSADLPQRFRIEPDDAASDVLAPRLDDGQAQRSRRSLVLHSDIGISPLAPSSIARYWPRTAKYSTLMRRGRNCATLCRAPMKRMPSSSSPSVASICPAMN